jgi:hypothetical protein
MIHDRQVFHGENEPWTKFTSDQFIHRFHPFPNELILIQEERTPMIRLIDCGKTPTNGIMEAMNRKMGERRDVL